MIAFSLALALAFQPGPAVSTQPYRWRNVEIGGGGFVDGILFHPSRRGLAYARTDIGGAYRLDERTQRWIPLLDWLKPADWNLYGVESIGLDPTDARRLYLAVGTYTRSFASDGAILRSDDEGRTFKRSDLPFKLGGNENGRSIGERLAVNPSKPSEIYFGSRNEGLWRSEDFGTTWNAAPMGLGEVPGGIGLGIVLFSGSKLYVAVDAPARPGAPDGFSPLSNLYESPDDGETWKPVPGQPAGFPHHAAILSSGRICITYSNGPGPNGVTDGAVWRLNPATDAWTDVTPIKPSELDRFGYAGAATGGEGRLLVSTLDRWAAKDDIFLSEDEGASWRPLRRDSKMEASETPFLDWGNPAPSFGWWIGDVALDPFDPNHALYGTGATIWGTHNLTDVERDRAVRWEPSAQGLEETAILDLASPPVGPPLLSAMGDIGGFRHDDLGRSPSTGMFQNPIINTLASIDFAAQSPNVAVRVGRGSNGRDGGVSSDGGQTWRPFPIEPPGGSRGGTVALSADGHAVVWCPPGGVPYASVDGGSTWIQSVGAPSGGEIISDRAAAATFYFYQPAVGRLYISEDGGVHFVLRSAEAPKGADHVRATPGHFGHIWIASSSGLYRSSDAGAHFAKVLGVDSARAVGVGKAAIGRSYPSLYLIGTIEGTDGFFRSDDEGAHWTRINDDRHRFATAGIIIGDGQVFGRVYVGTNGRGILVGSPRGALSER